MRFMFFACFEKKYERNYTFIFHYCTLFPGYIELLPEKITENYHLHAKMLVKLVGKEICLSCYIRILWDVNLW